MAQTERNDKALTVGDSAFITTDISTLRNNIQAGKVIRGTDITLLSVLINNWLGHFHTYDDAYRLATFGNNGNRTDLIEDKNTGSPGGVGGRSVETVYVNKVISQSLHNAMRNEVAMLQSHSHNIDDRTAV